MTTSPQTLLCQRRVTFLVPSRLCKLQSTFLHRRRPGARSRAGPTRHHTPGSPSLPPTSPAFLSHTLPTRTSSQEEAVKMEKKTRWMLMHPQVPGRFSGAAVLFCQPSHAIHATSAETGQGERLRRRRGCQCWAPGLVPTAGSLSGEPRSCSVRCAALAAACLQPLSPAKNTQALAILGEGQSCSGAW